jgi:hypothetical protein
MRIAHGAARDQIWTDAMAHSLLFEDGVAPVGDFV